MQAMPIPQFPGQQMIIVQNNSNSNGVVSLIMGLMTLFVILASLIIPPVGCCFFLTAPIGIITGHMGNDTSATIGLVLNYLAVLPFLLLIGGLVALASTAGV